MNLWKEKVVGSTLRRSELLGKRLRRDHEKLVDHHKEKPMLAFDGKKIPHDTTPRLLALDANRINRVVEKIVRCLYYRELGNILPAGANFEITPEPISEEKLEKVILERKGVSGARKNSFLYWYEFDETEKKSEWILLFFLQVHFVVRIFGLDYGEQ